MRSLLCRYARSAPQRLRLGWPSALPGLHPAPAGLAHRHLEGRELSSQGRRGPSPRCASNLNTLNSPSAQDPVLTTSPFGLAVQTSIPRAEIIPSECSA